MPATPTGRSDTGTPRGLHLSEMLLIQDQSDETGRLLLEDSASKKARRKATSLGVPMKTARCPYDETPSRYGRMMNTSAYEALRRDLTDVLDGFAWLRTQHLDPSGRGSVHDLAVVAKLGVTLPLLLFYRGEDPVPPHGSLPSYIASLFKASRGLFSVAVAMMNSTEATTTTGPEVVEFADRHRHLIRPETRRVCAAPTKLIARTIDVILTAKGGDPAKSKLPELLEFEPLWDFYLLEHALSESLGRYKFLLNEVTEQMRLNRVDPGSLFAQPVHLGPMRDSFGEVTETMLEHVNLVQARLNRVLGRRDSESLVVFDELLQML